MQSLCAGKSVAVSVAAIHSLFPIAGDGSNVLHQVLQELGTLYAGGPVYEEVTPIQEGIELKLNEEYGHAIINSM